jgi:hypothetical protein
MLAMVGVMTAALASVIAVVRRENRAAHASHGAGSKAAEDQCNS